MYVRTTMAERDAPHKEILSNMLEYELAQSEQTFDGELKAPEAVVYWRVGPSTQAGRLHLVLARKCERESEFDNMISFSTHYPGNAAEQTDVSSALQKINRLVQCI